MSLIQLLKFKKWETRLFKMPHFETPRFQTGTRVTVASGLKLEQFQICNVIPKSNAVKTHNRFCSTCYYCGNRSISHTYTSKRYFNFTKY